MHQYRMHKNIYNLCIVVLPEQLYSQLPYRRKLLEDWKILKKSGLSEQEIAKTTGISASTYTRRKKALKEYGLSGLLSRSRCAKQIRQSTISKGIQELEHKVGQNISIDKSFRSNNKNTNCKYQPNNFKYQPNIEKLTTDFIISELDGVDVRLNDYPKEKREKLVTDLYMLNHCNDAKYKVFLDAQVIKWHDIIILMPKIQDKMNNILKHSLERKESCEHLLYKQNANLQYYLYRSPYSPMHQLIQKKDYIFRLTNILKQYISYNRTLAWNMFFHENGILSELKHDQDRYILTALFAIKCKEECKNYNIESTLQGYTNNLDLHEITQSMYDLYKNTQSLTINDFANILFDSTFGIMHIMNTKPFATNQLGKIFKVIKDDKEIIEQVLKHPQGIISLVNNYINDTTIYKQPSNSLDKKYTQDEIKDILNLATKYDPLLSKMIFGYPNPYIAHIQHMIGYRAPYYFHDIYNEYRKPNTHLPDIKLQKMLSTENHKSLQQMKEAQQPYNNIINETLNPSTKTKSLKSNNDTSMNKKIKYGNKHVNQTISGCDETKVKLGRKVG